MGIENRSTSDIFSVIHRIAQSPSQAEKIASNNNYRPSSPIMGNNDDISIVGRDTAPLEKRASSAEDDFIQQLLQMGGR